MRLLLDTHILLWWLTDDQQLTHPVRVAIESPQNQVFVSAATLWEVAIKSALGRLDVAESFVEDVSDEGFHFLPVNAAHAWAQRSLPLHHRDPFDRMLIGQARVESLTLVSMDQAFHAYSVARLP